MTTGAATATTGTTHAWPAAVREVVGSDLVMDRPSPEVTEEMLSVWSHFLLLAGH